MNDDFYNYSEVEPLSGKRHIFLVKNDITGEKAVKRTVTDEELEIYNILKNINSNYFPHIIGIYNIDGQNVVLEEYLDGTLLSDAMEESPEAFDEGFVKAIAFFVCDALKIMHEHNIVYRDIKPENIMIYDGEIKLIDFNISRIYKQEASRDTEFLGTPGYAAPEQFGFKQSDMRADIYSVGVLMNKMLTGCLPVEKMYDGDLGRVIEKCVRLSPEDRYENIDILRGAIVDANEDIATELIMENSRRRDLHKGFCDIMCSSAIYFLVSSYINNCIDARWGIGFDYFNQVVKAYNPITNGGIWAYINSIPKIVILQMITVAVIMIIFAQRLKNEDQIGGVVWIGIHIIDMKWQISAIMNGTSLFRANSGIMWRDIANIAVHLACMGIIIYVMINLHRIKKTEERIEKLLEE